MKGRVESVLDLSELDVTFLYKQNIFTKFRAPRFLGFRFSINPFITDKNFKQSICSLRKMNFYMDGYFIDSIDQAMFDSYFSLIRKGFRKPLEKIDAGDGCVIHLRGTDFIGLGWDKTAPLAFYKKSIHKMKSEGVKFFDVVTDDIDYARSFFKGNVKIRKYVSTDTISDFFYISAFKYRILSASTFAFWASAFGNDRIFSESLTIAPSFWTPELVRKIRLKDEVRIGKF